jgi:hypothetical protein
MNGYQKRKETSPAWLGTHDIRRGTTNILRVATSAGGAQAKSNPSQGATRDAVLLAHKGCKINYLPSPLALLHEKRERHVDT